MGLLTQLIERRGKMMTQDYESNRWPSLAQYIAAIQSKAGVPVSETTAMNFIAVYSCTRLISETEASLPLFVYKRKEDGKEKRPDNPLYKILHDQPNPSMTAFQYRQTLMLHLLLWGNSYSEIIRNGGGDVAGLWPLRPDRMKVTGTVQNPVYEYTLDNQELKEYSREQIFHVPGLSYDGLIGYSPITLMREAVGLGLALEEFGSVYFRNGTNLGGVAEHPGKLSKTANDNLRKNLDENFSGVGNAHKLIILEEGMKYQKIGIPPEDAQFLETRMFQKREIAAFFNVPAHMIGDLEHATFSNIENLAIQFVVYSMRPWLVRLEQEIQRQLFKTAEQGKYFAEHLVDGLLRGDSKSRSEALQIQRQSGIINADEWRAIENMNPQEGDAGKVYLANGALTPIGMLGQGGNQNNGQGNQGTADTGTDDKKKE